MTLTVDQIKDLAEMAGLKVEGEITDDEKETEITVEICPPDGIKDRIDDGGDGLVRHYRHIAYLTDLWDEGVYPLGSPNDAVRRVLRNDPDVTALLKCCKALDRCLSPRMVKATLDFLADRYAGHPSPTLPKHLRVIHAPNNKGET